MPPALILLLVALQNLVGLLLFGERLHQLRPRHLDLRRALAGLEIGKPRLRAFKQTLRVAHGRRFRLAIEGEERMLHATVSPRATAR